MLDPVLIMLFLIVFIYKYRAPPQRPRPADLAFLKPSLSLPYLPSIGVKRCFSPLESEPEAPPKWLLLPAVLEPIPSVSCHIGCSFFAFFATCFGADPLAMLLSGCPAKIYIFFASFLPPVLEPIPSACCDLGCSFFGIFCNLF